MRFLVVDDSRAMQSIVKRTLQKAGYKGLEVRTASNGMEALDVIRVWKPELVLSDWHMPEMDGIELMARVTREMLDIKIGFVTTEKSPERIAEAKNAGAMFFVNKPFQAEELLIEVQPIIDDIIARNNAEMSQEPEISAVADTEYLLPNAIGFAEIVNDISTNEVLVEEVPALQVTRKQLPCLVGLIDDGKSEVVRAVCILELSAACILGAAMTGLGSAEVRNAIQLKTIDKNMVNGCERLLGSVVSRSIVSSQTGHPLQLRSVNVIPRIFPKLEEIYAEPRSGRSDFEVAMVGYGQGLMTIITARAD